LPIVIATARGDREDVVEALRLGANDYVTKPLDFRWWRRGLKHNFR